MTNEIFEHAVDLLLEETSMFIPAAQAQATLDAAHERVAAAERDLKRQIDAVHNQLALEIRQHNPALDVVLGRDGHVVVRYKNYSNVLHLYADVESKKFELGNSPFERRFRRYHGYTLDLGFEILGRAISDFFKQSYSSLGK